ncbi:MAG: ArsR/SmtB family transcription factor [Ilumatobacter sp.]|jgi:rhodanese-related sulfurtransferase/DNA-binding HxlR family transcriptional regulator|uniref:ArsR/SmtB family transcription factor n=1 Tax=Ilumatobacter sp. TaxID=1967498 RepID=UPI00391DBDE4
MGDRHAKDALFDAFGEVAKALANGRRSELIDVLVQGERHVDELASEIGQSVANTSFHLRVLATTGLVITRREGTRIYYRLTSPRVAELWAALRDVTAAHHANLDDLAAAYLGDRTQLEEIDRDELAARIATGQVVVVDVRPTVEYAAGHIVGARSIPIDRLAASIDSLPPDVEVVAYCRGPYCVFADDAVRELRRRGRAARRLVDGFPEWQRVGLPSLVSSS